MKKAIGLALAVLATTVVAASAQGRPQVAAASAAATVSCKSTFTLPLVTPVTGGAGFLGAEQGAWAKYAVSTLAKPLGLKVKFVILDFQEPYSLGLADAVEATLKKGGVATTRLSAPNTTTDYSAFVTKVPGDADIVFFPTQKPGDAQTFAQQLVEQGKKAKVFGGDGSNGPGQFKQAGSYVSNFAPDITGIKADASIIAGWKKANPGK